MKSYSPKIAAQLQVRPQVQHGLSRHQNPKLARITITSVLSERNHVNAATVFAKWLLKQKSKHLKNTTVTDAMQYLEIRSQTVRQKTLDLDRQMLNMHFKFPEKLNYFISKVLTVEEDRAYSAEQTAFLMLRVPAKLALSIALCLDGGLRSMELVTLAPLEFLRVSPRDWHLERFAGRASDVALSVCGKGGLKREVRISPQLFSQLQIYKRDYPIKANHCGAYLISYFDLLGGNPFCNQFSKTSRKLLGFSNGAHGLRYAFAQRRLLELIARGQTPDESLKILAQEMGHFSTSNTLTYLKSRFASG